MINSVLVAGMHTEGNQYVKYCEDMMLRWEHMPEIRNRHVPAKHDAVIIAAAIASHDLYHEVKEVYTQAGKPVFLSKKGVSEIKVNFEDHVFGHDALKALRQPLEFDDAIPIKYRVWWVLGRFLEPGDELRLKTLDRFFDKFLLKGHAKAVHNVWYSGRTDGYLETVGSGKAIFRGVPEFAVERLAEYNLTCEERKIMRQDGVKVRPRVVAPLNFMEEEAEVTEDVANHTDLSSVRDEDKDAMHQIILEALSHSQSEMRGLKSWLVDNIPQMIRAEMKGVNSVIGSIQPKLAELSPDQLAHIDQMITLMTSMPGRK
jgi:hypothetical protein